MEMHTIDTERMIRELPVEIIDWTGNILQRIKDQGEISGRTEKGRNQ